MRTDYFTYKSIFASYIEKFLKDKEQKGLLKCISLKCSMLEFDRFFIAENIRSLNITKDVILHWKSTRTNDHKRNLYKKYTAWVHFCRYLNTIGIECYIPQTPKEGRQNDYIPYIYTYEEINTIFAVSDNLISQRKNSNDIILYIIPCILRLLYSTAIRIGEALELKNVDVDLINKKIIIKNTKNNYERLAPINDSLLQVLQQYIKFRDAHVAPHALANDPNSYFFVSLIGNKCLYGNVRWWFAKILSFGNIPKQTYFNRPRLHDIRHTSAVHSLHKLVNRGTDIYCSLPMISSFLGHRNIKSTETYVRLTTEMFPELIEMEKAVSFVYPEMKFVKINNDYDGFC